jgi:hypothetical protein
MCRTVCCRALFKIKRRPSKTETRPSFQLYGAVSLAHLAYINLNVNNCHTSSYAGYFQAKQMAHMCCGWPSIQGMQTDDVYQQTSLPGHRILAHHSDAGYGGTGHIVCPKVRIHDHLQLSIRKTKTLTENTVVSGVWQFLNMASCYGTPHVPGRFR